MSGFHKVNAHNSWAVPVVSNVMPALKIARVVPTQILRGLPRICAVSMMRYSGGIVKWTQEELRRLDHDARKLSWGVLNKQ